jgi:L-ribulose-5-phosphate 3-epimerase
VSATDRVSRRHVLRLVGAVPVLAAARSVGVHGQPSSAGMPKVGLVSRHVQWTGLEDAIDIAARVGFDSIEWNVRTGGHIDPAHVERDLPRAVELTRKAGLAVEMITTAIQDAKSPHVEAILQTAAGLGIRCYRGGQYFRFDYTRDLWQQLQDLKPRVAGLAALNEKYGTVVAYHTHSAPGTIGGNIWDFWEVIRGFHPGVVGLNYDTGHATARNGHGWIDAAHVAARHITALALKDSLWVRSPKGGWRVEFVPLGAGMIDLKRLFELLKHVGFRGPVNVHYEHNELLGTDVGKWKLHTSRERFMEIVGKDLQYVRAQMSAAGM